MPNNSIISKNKMLVKKNKSKKKYNKKFKTIKKGEKNRNYMKKKGKSVIKNKSKKVNRVGLKLKIYGGSFIDDGAFIDGGVMRKERQLKGNTKPHNAFGLPGREKKKEERKNERLRLEKRAMDRQDIIHKVNNIFKGRLPVFKEINGFIMLPDQELDPMDNSVKQRMTQKMELLHESVDIDPHENITYMKQTETGNATLYKIMMYHGKEPLCKIMDDSQDVFQDVSIEDDESFLKRLFNDYHRYYKKNCSDFLVHHPEGIKIKDIAKSVLGWYNEGKLPYRMLGLQQGGTTLCPYNSITIPEIHSDLTNIAFPFTEGKINFYKSQTNSNRFRTFHFTEQGWPGDHLPLIFAKKYLNDFVFVQGSENVSFELSNGFCPSFASGRNLMEVFREQLSEIWSQNQGWGLNNTNNWHSLHQNGYYRIIKYILNFRNMLVGWSWGSHNADKEHLTTANEKLPCGYNLWIHFIQGLPGMVQQAGVLANDIHDINQFNELIDNVVDTKYQMFDYDTRPECQPLQLKLGQYVWNMQEFTEPPVEECNYMDTLLSLFKSWLKGIYNNYSIELNWFVGTSGFAKMLTVVMLVDNKHQHSLPFSSLQGKTSIEYQELYGDPVNNSIKNELACVSFFESSNNNKDNRPVTSLTFYSHNKSVLTCCIYVHLPQSLYTFKCDSSFSRTLSGIATQNWCPEFLKIIHQINNDSTSHVQTIIFVIQGDTNNLQKAYDNSVFQVLGTTFNKSFLGLGDAWNCTIYPSGDLRTGTAAWNGGLKNMYIVNDSGLVMICTRK